MFNNSCVLLIAAAVMLAAQSIQLGINDIVVAGGMESMSNAPKYIAEARLAFYSRQLVCVNVHNRIELTAFC